MVEINTDLYIFGGFDGTKYFNTLYRISFTDNSYSYYFYNNITEISPRGGHTMVSSNNDIYIFGGYNGTTYLNDLHRLRIDGNKYTHTEILPNDDVIEKRAYHTMANSNNYIYIYGGFNGTNSLNDLNTLTIDTNNTYTLNSNLLSIITDRYKHTMVLHNDHLYILGGITYNNYFKTEYFIDATKLYKVSLTGNNDVSSKDINYYNNIANNSMIVYDNDNDNNSYIYIYGGYTENSYIFSKMPITIITKITIDPNPIASEYTTSQYIRNINRRYGHCASVIGNNMYIYGGFSEIPDSIATYDTDINSLQKINLIDITLNYTYYDNSINFAKLNNVYNYALTNINEDIYIYGGWNNNTSLRESKLHKITITENTYKYSLLNEFAPDGSGNNFNRVSHSMVSANNDLYIFGGKDKNGNMKNSLLKITIDQTTGSSSIQYIKDIADITPRINCAMVVYYNYIYIYGGEYASNKYLTDFYRFDLNGNNVTEITFTGVVPVSRRYFSYTTMNNLLYIYGGWNTDSQSVNNLYKIELTTSNSSTFTEITHNLLHSVELPLLATVSMNSFNNKLYIFGGIYNSLRNNNLHIVTVDSNANTYIAIEESYDKITARNLAKLIIHNNDIYIYGGYLTDYGWSNDIHKLENNNYKHYKNITELPSINDSIITSYNSNIFIYDNEKLSRITVNNITNYTYTNYGKILEISNRTLAGITVFESNLYIFGGQDDNNIYLNDLYKISFDDNDYTYIESNNLDDITPRSQFGIETDGNYIYIFGGKVNDINYLNNLCKINIQDYTIVYNNQIAEIDRCINSSIIILDDYLLIYGGKTETDQFNNNLHRLNIITLNYKDVIADATPYFNNTNKIIGNGNIVYILSSYSISSITSISFSSKDYYIKTINIEEYYFDEFYLSYINDKLYIYTHSFRYNSETITNVNIFVIDLSVFNNYILPGNFNTKFKCQDITIRTEQTEWSINTTTNMNFYKDSVLIAYLDNNTQNVNLNFTGQHITLLKDTKDYNGYIVCADGSYYNRSISNYSRFNSKQNINIIESLPNVILSNKIKDPAVFGVISNKYQDFNMSLLKTNKIENKSYESAINSIGEGAIWVSNYNGNLNNGDYITSSVIPGIGMKQDDDLLHNYTVAKITMNCDFNPNYIPLQKMKTDGSNILFNQNNDIIYEYEYDVNSNIKYDYEYDLKYIRLNGDIIDKNTYDLELSKNMQVYKIAFVGCTYHCG